MTNATGGPVWAVVAGRMGSSRLPGKTMSTLAGRPSLRHILDRLATVPELDGVVVATTESPEDDAIRRCASEAGVACYSGDPVDVLGRTLAAAHSVGAATIVQVTGDCPLIDPGVVGRVVRAYRDNEPDYAANQLGEHRTFPAGLAVEVFSTEILERVAAITTDTRDREHVSIYIYEHPDEFSLLEIEATGSERRPDLWLTLDTADDLRAIGAVFDGLYEPSRVFTYGDVLAYLDAHPDVEALNRAPA